MQEGGGVSLLVLFAFVVHCSHAVNGEVKKIPGTASIRIVPFHLSPHLQEHILPLNKLSEDEKRSIHDSFATACKYNHDLSSLIDKANVVFLLLLYV